MFYNPRVFEEAGVGVPLNWDDFLSLCRELTLQGFTPISLGANSRWPAQFWFDYLLLRTAGPGYRARLMTGGAHYTDAEVVSAMGYWKSLIEQNCFGEYSSEDDWRNASDRVVRGDAAMTLMGTWITDYWSESGLVPLDDYDVFEFPTINEEVPKYAVGALDGWLVAANHEDYDSVKKLLAFLARNREFQSHWATQKNWLTPTEGSASEIYGPVMERAYDVINGSDGFAFVYDLATEDTVVRSGFDMFSNFVKDPSRLEEYLNNVEFVAMHTFADG